MTLCLPRQDALTATGAVVAVGDNLITVHSDDRLIKNEVAYVCVGDRRLKAEVLRVRGRNADLQVYEDTHGIRVGDPVELTGQMLSVTLGPGLLGQVYDGLQMPLHVLAARGDVHLAPGAHVDPLDRSARWPFTPSVGINSMVYAGDVLGTVPECHLAHRIMVPFGLDGPQRLLAIHEGVYTVDEPVARLGSASGEETLVYLRQNWPVRSPLPLGLFRQRLAERLFPQEPLATTIRIMDTLFPIAKGGTACIPGPFGAGKTVLQGLLAQHADVDVVIVVACGERAGEVVETINLFPELTDPRTGRSLMDRTIVVCNTSSMPVAARESSIYTGLTFGEYYRQMGYSVLLIADSTSRWAQALREISGRMEEIPGDEAYPAYLDSAIKGIYERAGVVRSRDGTKGSLTMVGTVSPAGGNLEEPVTQCTLGIVKTFLALSSERAYKRFYPAIDPLLSWSRYSEQLRPWLDGHLGAWWTEAVVRTRALLKHGDQAGQMMQVTGEEGISIGDYVLWQKAMLVDLVYLQQNARDPVDASTPLERQAETFALLQGALSMQYTFANNDEARDFFTRLAHEFRNWNYIARDSSAYAQQKHVIERLIAPAGQ